MDYCDESCRNVCGGPFSLPDSCDTIPGAIDGRLQPVPLKDRTNVNPRPPDRASRPAASALTGASQSDGHTSNLPGIVKWKTPEDKEAHRAARVKGWSEKRQKGWSANFTPEEHELVHRRFDAEDVLDAIVRSPKCVVDFYIKEWGDVMTTYVQNIIDGARKSKIKKNDACADVIQANFYAAFELCLNPLLESLGRSRISSPCALDATVECLRQKLDPVNPTIIHGISVCARGGGGGELLANHAGAPPHYSLIHRAFEEVSQGAVFFDLPSNPFTCAPQACQTYHCMKCTVGGKWFHIRFLHSWAGTCEEAFGLKIVAVALIGETSVLMYGSRCEIAKELGVSADIITGVPHYFYIYTHGVMRADVLRLGVLKIKEVVADVLTVAEDHELKSLIENDAERKLKRKRGEGAGPLVVLHPKLQENVEPSRGRRRRAVSRVARRSDDVIHRVQHHIVLGAKGDKRAVCDGTVMCAVSVCKTDKTSVWHPGENPDEKICHSCYSRDKVRTCWSHARVPLHRVPPHLSSSRRLTTTTSAPGAAPRTDRTGSSPGAS